MLDYLKNLKLIDTLTKLLKALGFIRITLTVVIIAVSVITGAKYISAPRKIE